MNKNDLCLAALAARKSAYTPYSGFNVGAALLTKSGKVFTGCNIENSAFSPTVCAERVAVFKAVSEGERDFVAIAVAGGQGDDVTSAAYPCGVCRQVLSEFCSPDFAVLCVTDMDGGFEEYALSDLLPKSFSLEK